MEVTGAGLIPVDHIFRTDKVRSKPEDLRYLGSSGGGSIGNTLSMLSLLGHSCSVFGLVGNDEAARIVRSDFTQFGVNHSGLVRRGSPRDPRPTRQYSHLIRPDGAHTFSERCLKCGQPFTRSFLMTGADVTSDQLKLVRSSKLLFLDRVNGASDQLAQTAQEKGVSIGFDLGFPRFGPSLESVKRVLRISAFVKTQEDVLRKIVKKDGMDAVQLWKESYPATRLLLVTRGAKGVRGFWRGKDTTTFFDLPAIRCEHLQDTAGAGDVLQAVAFHLFLAAGQPKSERDVIRRVDLAQSLASLSCSLYGARALQRALLNQRTSGPSIIEVAERIADQKRATNSFPPGIGLPAPLSNPSRLVQWRGCPVCGRPVSLERKVRREPHVTENYRNALSVSHLLMSHAFELGRSIAPRIREHYSGPTVFVGSGGSLSAASFASTLLVKGMGRVATTLPPFEIWNLDKIEEETVVCLLSHGGENKDILMAADRLSRLNHDRVVVITSSRTSPLWSIAKSRDWLTILVEGQERGFVATSGLLSMIAAIAGAFSSKEMESAIGGFLKHENLLQVFKQSFLAAIEGSSVYSPELRSDHLVVLASGWGWPAAVDFESKIVEGGVCTVELSEMKNFTHGRYVNSFHHRERRHFVLFVSPEESELSRFMQRKLARFFNPILVVETQERGLAGATELVVRALYLAGQLAHRAGVDLASPRYPSEARGLYGWAPQGYLDSSGNPKTG
jgi:sugar/nucleoside kinase (ribokinase family)/fructoselysine-6-P-deglycase FrlB-like protein